LDQNGAFTIYKAAECSTAGVMTGVGIRRIPLRPAAIGGPDTVM